MRFIYTIRESLLAIAFVALACFTYGQETSTSPFTSFGIGEMGTSDNGIMSGLGNSNVSVLDSTLLNYYNPATYNYLAQGNPIFSVGTSSRFSFYEEGDLTSFCPHTSISHFALAVPFKNWFGLAFGLKPYSRRGYEFSNSLAVDTDSLLHTYSGTGNINEAFVGFSTNVFRLDSNKTRLAVGANIGYLFGTTTNQRTSTIIQTGGGNTVGGVEQRNIRARSIHYELGMYFTHNFGKKHTLSISATADLSQKLNLAFTEGLYYATNVTNPATYDTLAFYGSSDSSSRITSIPTYNVGVNYIIRRAAKEKNNRLNNEWSFHATYAMSDWSAFTLPSDGASTVHLNTQRFTAGVEFIPESDRFKNSMSKYYERMRYRMGAYYYTLPYAHNGTQVSDFGTTFGIGLPIALKGSMSSVNFGVSLGQRGNGDPASLNEKYIGFNVGLSFAPVGDRWFLKRKWD